MYTKYLHFVYTFIKNFYILLFLLCLSTLRTMPIADINTNKEVEPADINGSGKPVGGIEPLNISYCIIKKAQEKNKLIALSYTLSITSSDTHNLSLVTLLYITSATFLLDIHLLDFSSCT